MHVHCHEIISTSGAFPERVKRGGIWSEIKPGKIVKDGKETLVAVKLYTQRASNVHLLSEEQHLRYVWKSKKLSCRSS